jgi:hypothetical protein
MKNLLSLGLPKRLDHELKLMIRLRMLEKTVKNLIKERKFK